MLWKVVTTDAYLTGWGATKEDRKVNGVWPSILYLAHINYLELLTVWKDLNNFLPRLRGNHVIVSALRQHHSHSTYQPPGGGGMHFSKLHALAHKLLVWSKWHFLSLLATHVPCILNKGADLLSRGNPLYGDWCFHPQIVSLLWKRFGQAAVDLFASCREILHPHPDRVALWAWPVKGQTRTHWVCPHLLLPLFKMLEPLLNNPNMIASGVCSRSGVMSAS